MALKNGRIHVLVAGNSSDVHSTAARTVPAGAWSNVTPDVDTKVGVYLRGSTFATLR